jgi:hypothetical protein
MAFIALQRLPSGSETPVVARRLLGGDAFRALVSHGTDEEHPSRDVIERSLRMSAEVEVHQVGFIADATGFEEFVGFVERIVKQLLQAH